MAELTPVDCVVSGDIQVMGLAPKPLERLRQGLQLPNPEFRRARRMGTTAGIPPFIGCLLEEPDGSVRLPRGATELLRASLAADDLRPRYVDRRALGEELLFDVEAFARAKLVRPPRYYQVDGVVEIVKSLQGTIVIPTAGGKTTLGALAIATLARTTLVLVHTEDLLDQWVSTIRTWLGIEPGTVKGGKVTPAPVTVAMVITLAGFLETAEGEAFARGFGLVLVDEAHHAPGPATFQRCLRRLPARARVGLTATPDREDGMTPLMDWSFGKRLLEVDVQTLVRRGWLMPPAIEWVPSDFKFTYELPAVPSALDDVKRLAKLQKAVVLDKNRNDLIANLASREWKAGETVLVLTNHKAHCRMLARLCVERGVGEAVALVAEGTKSGKARRKATIEAMRAGTCRLVVATSLADEGLDIVPLSRIVLALPERARGRATQRVGRLMRVSEGKAPKLFDVTDPNVDTLVRRADERRRTYKSLGLLP